MLVSLLPHQLNLVLPNLWTKFKGKMKLSFSELLILATALSLSFILSEEFSNRRGRPSKLPRRPPMQIHKNFLKSIKHTPKKTFPPSRKKNPISRVKPPPKIQDKQLLVAQPTPLGFNFRLAAAILIPAIPTLIGYIMR